MKVYPVNALEAAGLASLQKEPYAVINDLFNRYIEYQVDFNDYSIELTGHWPGLISIDSFIIGNTNAKKGSLQFIADNNIIYEKEFLTDSYINIIEILNEYNLLEKINIDKFILKLQGYDFIKIGYIYVGEVWELPRFTTYPRKKVQLRNESSRTFAGQVMGIPISTLKSFSVDYKRINNESMKLYEKYIEGVQTVIPHIIDPYPEAHNEFEPFFATVSEFGEPEKRDESGFYWNFNVSWQEAR